MSVDSDYRNYKEQEHNHMHAFGATLFMIVLVGLIALSYIWQTRNTNEAANGDSILAASAVSVVAPSDSDELYQPEETGALLEGDSLNGFQSDYVGYVNQAYGLSFSMNRDLKHTAEVGQQGLSVVLASEQEDDTIRVLAKREKEAAQYVSSLLYGGESFIDGEVGESQTKTGFEVVQYQVVEGEGVRFVTALAGEDVRYDVSLVTSADRPEDSELYDDYQYVLDNLFIQ